MLLTMLASPARAEWVIAVGDCIVGEKETVCTGPNISGLAKYPEITSLDLRVVPSDLHVLQDLPALGGLKLGNDGDTVPVPSDALKQLASLGIEDLKLRAPAQDLSVLASMPKLRFLDASGTDYSRAGQSLKDSATLETLHIGGGPNTDLSDLAQSQSLKSVAFIFRFKEPVVKVGETFTVPTFKGLDGKSFKFSQSEYDEAARPAGMNTFTAIHPARSSYMEWDYYETPVQAGDRSIGMSVYVAEGARFTATDVLKATKVKVSPEDETATKGTYLLARPESYNYPEYKKGYSCEWFRDGKATGVKSCTYKLTTADSNKNLDVLVTVTATQIASSFLTPVATKHRVKYTVLDLFNHKVKVTGTTKVGSKLKAETGKTPSGTKKSYRWMRDGKSIKGATHSTYTPTATDLNRRLSVKVSASKSGFVSLSKTSSKTAKIGKGSLKIKKYPAISGSHKTGKTLNAKSGTWSAKPDKYRYQWYRNGAAISKASKSSYRFSARDHGKVIYVKVTAHKKGYASKSVNSRVR